MFSWDLKQNVLNLIRIMLPIDTGNLRYNATNAWGNSRYMEFNMGGARANYLEFLEEKKWSKHYKNIDEVIVPSVVNYLEQELSGNSYGPKFSDQIQETISNQIGANKITQRNQTLLRSLEREGVSAYEYLYTRTR